MSLVVSKSHVVSKLACSLLLVVSGAFAAFAQGAAPPEVVKEIAPTGKLRAAINLGNAVLAQKGATARPRASRSISRASWPAASVSQSTL